MVTELFCSLVYFVEVIPNFNEFIPMVLYYIYLKIKLFICSVIHKINLFLALNKDECEKLTWLAIRPTVTLNSTCTFLVTIYCSWL